MMSEEEFAADRERFAAMIETGVGPPEIYARATQKGYAQIHGIRLLRALFGLSLAEAREISWEVDGRPANVLPKISSPEDLAATLKSELGYCACAGDILTPLCNFLQIVQDRTDAAKDLTEFSRLTRLIESRVCPPDSADFLIDAAAWLIFALEQKHFLWHGFRLTDLWINPKGRALLAALKEFPLTPCGAGAG